MRGRSLRRSSLGIARLQLAEGQRIQYNFVKPHMALEGQTPAQAAGLASKGWMELLMEALEASGAN